MLEEGLLPIVLLALGFVILTSFLNHKRRLLEHRERMAALEKGLPIPPPAPAIPPEALMSSPLAPRDILRRGLLWLGIGLGTLTAMIMAGGEVARFAFCGLIPAFVGVAYLIFYLVDPQRRAEKDKFPPLS